MLSPAKEGPSHLMSRSILYPMLFEPIYQYRLWGGRHLADLLKAPLPDGPIGEAWILSDRDDHASLVTNGSLKGQTLRQLMDRFPRPLLGRLAHHFRRFPLLLKFLDAHEMLSVQVHPSDAHKDLLPPGETGKTEAWVVLEAGANSRICAGLKPGTKPDTLRDAISNGTVESRLAGFTPKSGDGIFIPAGTVHSLGGDIVVFEIQQNSDVTFRLYDWKHVDPTTGQPRGLQVDQALACIDFSQGEVTPVTPLVETATPVTRERLFHCGPFSLWRVHGESAFCVGVPGEARVLVCTSGAGDVEYDGETLGIERGNVLLLPAEVGACAFRPSGMVDLLEIALPELTK